MKLGVLTLPIKTNYGGILQAYASVRFLRSLGYDAWFIKRRWNEEGQSVPHKIAKWFYHSIIIWKFNKFIDKYITPQTEVIDSREKVGTLKSRSFDGYVVGSDQVWRIRNVRGADYNYFLDFTEGQKVKRVAYAASFGVDYWDDDQDATQSVSQIKPLIEKFDGISVREDTGVGLCKSLFGVEAKHMLDPTLLLEKEDYIDNLRLKIQQKQFIAVYILDMTPDKQLIVDKISDYHKLPVKHINKSKIDFLNHLPNVCNEICKPSVEEWLTAIGEAAFVVTDSFHGLAFSINFEKQFVAIGNPNRGLTRFSSLLRLFDLEKRLVLKSTDFEADKALATKIDYNKVAAERKQLIKNSTDFINSSLA